MLENYIATSISGFKTISVPFKDALTIAETSTNALGALKSMAGLLEQLDEVLIPHKTDPAINQPEKRLDAQIEDLSRKVDAMEI